MYVVMAVWIVWEIWVRLLKVANTDTMIWLFAPFKYYFKPKIAALHFQQGIELIIIQYGLPAYCGCGAGECGFGEYWPWYGCWGYPWFWG